MGAYSTISTMQSIMTDDLEHCINCGRKATHCHHCINGSDKRWSEKFLLLVPMCHECHMQLHNNAEMERHYKKLAQEAFEEVHPDKKWLDYFLKNYR